MVDLTMIHLSNHLNAHLITFVYNFFLNVSHQSTTYYRTLSKAKIVKFPHLVQVI